MGRPKSAASTAKPQTLPDKVVTCHVDSDVDDSGTAIVLDLTTIPKALDAKFEEFDEDSAVRPTIITAAPVWERKTHKSLLSKAIVENLGEKELRDEKNKAFDLLDALSRSGALPIACAEVHAIVGATHCFDLSVIDTIVQKNVNPIEKLERSLLIVASTIYGTAETKALLRNEEQVLRISKHSPTLLLTSDDAPGEE